MATYSLSIVGVLLVCLLSIVLAVYSGSSKGRAKALSGPVLPADDDNLLYRIDRVHMNSVEALTPFVVPSFAGDDGRRPAGVTCNACVDLYCNPSDPRGGVPTWRQRCQGW